MNYTYPQAIEAAKKNEHCQQAGGFIIIYDTPSHLLSGFVQGYTFQLWYPEYDGDTHTISKPTKCVAAFILSKEDKRWRQV